MHTYTADYNTPEGPARKIIHTFGAKTPQAALRAVQHLLTDQGINAVEIVPVPPKTPLDALKTESCTVVYLPVYENSKRK